MIILPSPREIISTAVYNSSTRFPWLNGVEYCLMKSILWGLLVVIVILLAGCQPRSTPVTVLADDQTFFLDSIQRIPSDIIAEAGILLGPEDRILFLGSPVPPDLPLPAVDQITLLIRRSIELSIDSSDGRTWKITTSAQTVGEAFFEAGLILHANDRLDPPAETPLTGDLSVSWQPASEFYIQVDGLRLRVRSAATTIGQALAESGLAMMGLDYSIPSENDPLPADGEIRIVRVVESVALTLKSLPYGSRTELSADLEIDQKALVKGGETGLAIARLRTRAEDGTQVSQISESESIVRPPQDQILGVGTKIVIRTTVVGGETIEYWRALTLFATYYIPCGPGQPRCYYGTASGTLVRRGAVAMVYPWYLLFAGENLYIPGYGFGTVEDNNGALTNAFGDTYWVDLGYSMEDVVDWENQYVVVYFLTPVPANVADTYILP